MSMPPYAFWLQGPEPIKAWLLGRGASCRGSRLLRTEASGMPALAQYHPQPDGSFAAWGLIILEREQGRIAAWNTFLDVEKQWGYLEDGGLTTIPVPSFTAATTSRSTRNGFSTPVRSAYASSSPSCCTRSSRSPTTAHTLREVSW